MNKKNIMILLSLGFVCLQASQDGSQSDNRSLHEQYIASQSPVPLSAASPVPFSAASPVLSMADLSIASSPSPDEIFKKSPVTRALFTAIANGADAEFINILYNKALRSSPSPVATDEMNAKYLQYHREISPKVMKIQENMQFAENAAGKAQLRNELHQHQLRYRDNSPAFASQHLEEDKEFVSTRVYDLRKAIINCGPRDSMKKDILITKLENQMEFEAEQNA